MRSDIKRFRRCDETVERLERHFEIERVFAPHNLPVAKCYFVLRHRLSKLDSKVTTGKLAAQILDLVESISRPIP
jgi:hypothetical protein